MSFSYKKIAASLSKNKNLRLFLDYDGTLADFVDSPDQVKSNPEVVELLTALRNSARITIAIISGRRLAHLQKLIPIKGITLAGTYGIEMQLPNGAITHRDEYAQLRPVLEKLIPGWQNLIEDYEGFHLEDKGWSLALHARFAKDKEAERILAAAADQAKSSTRNGLFKILTGHKFLEICPILADKGECVRFLLNEFPACDETVIYMGDDDKDEQAFRVIQAQGGLAIRVCSNVIHDPIENWRIENPSAARKWLYSLTE